MKRLKDNSGMTLVELMVSVAILAILMTGVTSVITAASKYFTDSQREIEVQNQLQTTFVQVSNLIVDASLVLDYTDAGLIAANSESVGIVEKADKKLYVNILNYPDDCITDAEKVAFAQNAISGGKTTKDKNHLITEHCEFFKVRMDPYINDEGYVTLAIKLEYQTRSAYLSQNVFIRNSTTGTGVVGGVKVTPTITKEPTPVEEETVTETEETPTPTEESTTPPLPFETVTPEDTPSEDEKEEVVTKTVTLPVFGTNYRYIELGPYMNCILVSYKMVVPGAGEYEGCNTNMSTKKPDVEADWSNQVGYKVFNKTHVVNKEISSSILWFDSNKITEVEIVIADK